MVLVSFIGGPWTCNSLIGGPGNFSMHSVYHRAADVDRLYTPCTNGGGGLQQIEPLDCCLHSSSDPFMQMVQECDARRSSHLIRRMAVSLLHSCRGVWLGTTSRRACMEVGPSCVMASSSEHLRWMRNISACAAVLFVYSPGA